MAACLRPFKVACMVLLALALPALAMDAPGELEAQVRQIEQLAYTAAPAATNARIAALEARKPALTLDQRQRIEYVRLRGLGLLGRQVEAVQGMSMLLRQDLQPALRNRAYASAIHMAANLENWPLAFGLLEESQQGSSEPIVESAILSSAAAYLYAQVDELERARKMGKHALQLSERLGAGAAQCRALAVLVLVDLQAKDYRAAEDWSKRQQEVCSRAGDKVFSANAGLGLGKAAAGHGRHVQALAWAEQALAGFREANFEAGTHSAGLAIADSLIALRRQPERARALLQEAAAYYQHGKAPQGQAAAEFALARLAEQNGDIALALGHMKAERLAAQAASCDLSVGCSSGASLEDGGYEANPAPRSPG